MTIIAHSIQICYKIANISVQNMYRVILTQVYDYLKQKKKRKERGKK